MRARTAYISSIGTTTILVGASLLMLALVSALVAFHGWPDRAGGRTVPSVGLDATPQPVFRLVRVAQPTPYVRVLAGGRALGSRAATVGLVKIVPVRAPTDIGLPLAVEPGRVSQPAQQPHGSDPGNPGHASPPGAPELAQPPAPPTPADVAALVTALVGSVQPPAGGGLLPRLPVALPPVQRP
jgi:hypothetical protein